MNPTTTRTTLGVLTALASVAGVAPAQEQPFDAYFNVRTKQTEKAKGNDWVSMLDLGDAPWNHDVVIFYDREAGNFPKAGPHMLYGDPALLEAHLEQLKADVEQKIPDPAFDGIAVLDYEAWKPHWYYQVNVESDEPLDAHDSDQRDDWEETLLVHHPSIFDGLTEAEKEEVLRDTWNEFTKEFYLKTLTTCQEMRPNARWCYWDFPQRFYFHKDTPGGTRGYGDHTHPPSKANDDLAWLWEAQDAMAPVIYPFMRTVPIAADIEDKWTDDVPEENFEFISSYVAECKRLAPDKPVYPYIWYRYSARCKDYKWQWVNKLSMERQILASKEAGADGVILWGSMFSESEYNDFQEFLTNTINPLVKLAVGQDEDDKGEDGGDGENAFDNGGEEASDVLTFAGDGSERTRLRRPHMGRAAYTGGKTPPAEPDEGADERGGGSSYTAVTGDPDRVSVPGNGAGRRTAIRSSRIDRRVSRLPEGFPRSSLFTKRLLRLYRAPVVRAADDDDAEHDGQ